tara:strand:- start:30886 stop:31068 length:183 start_codon:yes stop_codon:yes gene_type:complete
MNIKELDTQISILLKKSIQLQEINQDLLKKNLDLQKENNDLNTSLDKVKTKLKELIIRHK